MALGGNLGEFQIRDWRIQPSLLRVVRGERTHRLEPKVMEVLVCLAERPGETVTREALMERVWHGTYVSEDVLSRSVSILRKVFEDSAANPSVIETIPKLGYRLIAPVTPPQPAAVPRNWRRWAALLAVCAALAVVGLTARVHQPPPAPVTLRSVTSFPGRERMPAIAPDGETLAYVRDGDLYLHDFRSASPRRLTRDADLDRSPAISRGGRVAFIRASNGRCGIYVIPGRGGDPRELLRCDGGEHGELSWSPDDRFIAFSEKRSGSFALSMLSVEDGKRTPLTRPPATSYGDRFPSFSPDGKMVAFARGAFGAQDLHVVPAAGGQSRALTEDNTKIHAVAWSRDGARILYASDRGGRFSIWSVPWRGGQPVWLGFAGDGIAGISAARDRDRLAYEQVSSDANIWSTSLTAGSSSRLLLSSTEGEWTPRHSPDGRQIAFASNRSGAKEIWVADADGTAARQVTALRSATTGAPRWSPDGQQLVFHARHRNNGEIYLVDARGGLPRRVAEHPADDLEPTWSRDGRSIYFSSNRSGAPQIWRLSLDGGSPVQITRRGGFVSAPSPDGRAIIYSRYNESGLWTVPVDGGEERLLLPDLSTADWNNWDVTARGIVFLRRDEHGQRRVVLFDEKSGRQSILAALGTATPFGISVSPDGRSLLVSRLDRDESNIMLAENAVR